DEQERGEVVDQPKGRRVAVVNYGDQTNVLVLDLVDLLLHRGMKRGLLIGGTGAPVGPPRLWSHPARTRPGFPTKPVHAVWSLGFAGDQMPAHTFDLAQREQPELVLCRPHPVGFENPVGDAGLQVSELLASRFVLVNQPVENPSPSESLGGEAGWRQLGWPAAQGAVRPVLAVVLQVLGEHLPQVSFTIDEQVVGAFPAQGTNPALADCVCPGCLDRSPDDLDAFGSEDGVEADGVFGVPVPDQGTETMFGGP